MGRTLTKRTLTTQEMLPHKRTMEAFQVIQTGPHKRTTEAPYQNDSLQVIAFSKAFYCDKTVIFA